MGWTGLWEAVALLTVFWLGRVLSVFVYVSTWTTFNGFIALHAGSEETATKLWSRMRGTRCLLLDYIVHGRAFWVVHLAILCSLSGGRGGLWWDDQDHLIRTVGVLHCALMSFGKATLRLGHVDLGNFFFADRGICVALCIGAWASPILFYVAVIQACCLTYTVGCSSGLAQPYSNYLGFEYCRWMACFCLSAAVTLGGAEWLAWVGVRLPVPAGVPPLAILTASGAYYFAQGAGKCRLGTSWFEWLLENRIENLWINAVLRGHLKALISVPLAVSIAKLIRCLRIPMNGAGLLAELLGVTVALSQPLSMFGVALRSMFHLAVAGMTGLVDWEGIIGNAVVAKLLHANFFESAFQVGPEATVIAVVCVILSDQWGVWVSERPDMGTKLMLFDAADLPMCWWDSPYMRMFEWSVECENRPGEELSFPVTLFSPYDTLITDVHTRLMNLQLYPGLDRTRSADRSVIKSGVWGLLLQQRDARVVYDLIDTGAEQSQLEKRFCPVNPDPWVVTSETEWDDSPTCVALYQFFNGWNKHVDQGWFRTIGATFGGLHWPGEDVVPDTSPLRQPCRETYSVMDGPITVARIRRIKTWFTGDRVLQLEDVLIGTIHVKSDRAPRTPSQHKTNLIPSRMCSGDIGVLSTC